MHWIIQSDLSRESALVELVELLERFEIPFDTVRVAPFGAGIDPDLEVVDPAVVVGSVSLARHAIRMGWKPGAWLGRRSEDDFAYDSCISACGSEMLNADARSIPFGDLLVLNLDNFFVRPVADSKLFAGTVLLHAEATEWRDRLRSADSRGTITPETPILVSTVKPILTETRFVVVDGKVVTGSLYRRGRTVIHSPEIEPHVLAYARARAAGWTPDRVCVMDVADTPNGPRIIEFNNFNSAGWYACDVSKIVQAIEALT
jgi:hypothetical protein